MTRTDIPPTWGERAMLTTFLDYTRATVREKCTGVTDELARLAPLPGSPLMTLAGLVSHVTWVEYHWIQVVFLGEQDAGPWTEQEPDREFSIALDKPIARLLDEYDAQSDRYRALIAETDLSTLSQRNMRRTGEPVTLGWILMHLIEETARHNGHIDIIREMADGVTGY